jgi:hypothetical protein
VKLPTHLQLEPRSRKRGSIHPLPHTPPWHSAYLVQLYLLPLYFMTQQKRKNICIVYSKNSYKKWVYYGSHKPHALCIYCKYWQLLDFFLIARRNMVCKFLSGTETRDVLLYGPLVCGRTWGHSTGSEKSMNTLTTNTNGSNALQHKPRLILKKIVTDESDPLNYRELQSATGQR